MEIYLSQLLESSRSSTRLQRATVQNAQVFVDFRLLLDIFMFRIIAHHINFL